MILALRSALALMVAVTSVYSMCAPGTIPCNDVFPPPLDATDDDEITVPFNFTWNFNINPGSENGTQPKKDKEVQISKDMFRRAVALGWGAAGGTATDEQYNIFASSVETKAKVSSKRELSMLLANILHESDRLRSTEEQGPPYAPSDQDPAHPDRSYHGRGYLMLRGYENYKNASIGLYGDERLVENPDLVKNETVAWETAFWFWANQVHGQKGISDGNFGTSKGIISNYTECDGPFAGMQRFRIYIEVLNIVAPGEAAVEYGCRD